MKEIKTYIIDMKTLKQHIFEKLKVGVSNTTKHTLFPKTKNELQQMIKDEISKNGNECSLNHIDVSRIIDMSRLFYGSDFNGDISDWDVYDVTTMQGMFAFSKFNGNISNWNVSNVTNMSEMFYRSKFVGDISKWNVSNVKHMNTMFLNSPLENNPPAWYKE